jgi:TRAP-type C4-dicarboxylate transport system permease small subunit
VDYVAHLHAQVDVLRRISNAVQRGWDLVYQVSFLGFCFVVVVFSMNWYKGDLQ